MATARRQPGDDISYRIRVANTGNVTLTGVTVTDPLPITGSIDCNAPRRGR